MITQRYILILILLINTIGCGTDTGNPIASDSNHVCNPCGDPSRPEIPRPIPGERPFVKILAEFTCEKLMRCHDGLNFGTCISQIYQLENVDTEIGLREREFDNLRQVFTAEIQMDIEADIHASDSCLLHYSQLSCNDEVIQNSYLPDEKTPMILFAESLPESCQEVFSDANTEGIQ